MKLKSLLGQIYEPFGNEWVKGSGIVFDIARNSNVSLAGSIAIAVARKKAAKAPGDIDFVAPNSEDAQKFIAALQNYLLTKSVYWKVQVNSRTHFCPKGCVAHFRMTVPFWLPICVMVIGEVSSWRVEGGNQIQSFDDVVEAAKDLQLRDGKDRTSHLEEIDTGVVGEGIFQRTLTGEDFIMGDPFTDQMNDNDKPHYNA
jgi:hypothetical protein